MEPFKFGPGSLIYCHWRIFGSVFRLRPTVVPLLESSRWKLDLRIFRNTIKYSNIGCFDRTGNSGRMQMTIHCLLLTRANPNDAKKCDMTPGEEETGRAIRNLYLFTFSNKAAMWQALNILRATLYSGGFKLRGGNSWMNFHCCHSKHFFSSSATLHRLDDWVYLREAKVVAEPF